jgi:hypothetical protein
MRERGVVEALEFSTARTRRLRFVRQGARS